MSGIRRSLLRLQQWPVSSSVILLTRNVGTRQLLTGGPLSRVPCCAQGLLQVPTSKLLHYQTGGGHAQLCARFKLKVERKEAAVAVQEAEEGKEGAGGDDKEEAGDAYLKSHPYRKLANVWSSKSELAKHLIDNVIHDEHGLFVTNKPFGVGVRNPSQKKVQQNAKYEQESLHLRGIPTCPYTLEDLVPELRYLLGKPNLVLARSTEKLTSGVAVFAEGEKTAELFLKRVASAKIHFDTLYQYHVVTVLPPVLIGDPSQTHRYGITIKHGVGSDVGQPVILYQYSINSVKKREVKPVHCQTKLVHAGVGGAYLVEVNTSSIANNFLRVHCADKLAPILGDHLYSSRVQTVRGIPAKIDPTHLTPGVGFQKLPVGMQESLQLKKPEDSLMIPTHVHLKSYQVRKFPLGSGRDSVIKFEAPYPPHFKWTCKQLGIVLEADSIRNSD